MRVPVHLCVALSLIVLSIAQPAAAHFQEILPSADVLPAGGSVTIDLVFTHPFEQGPVMAMARPAEMGVLRGGVLTDLVPDLAEKPVAGKLAWTLTHELPEPGAAVFFVVPQPYWEASEARYIVHYAKVVVDSFASGTGWDALVGLPVEIQPLVRPTGLWTGNAFRGIVLQGGKAVPFAEIEVEFVNDAHVTAPNDAFITQVIKADQQGVFSYTMPRAGWWGFAALLEGAASMTAPDGRDVPVEEGALMWVKTTEMGGI